MAWKDTLKNAKEVFKKGTAKEKISYLWYYFKWHFIILLLVIAMAADLIYTNVTAKDYVLQGMFLNVLVQQDLSAELEQAYLRQYPIDTDTQDIFFDTSLYYSPNPEDTDASASYETMQVITARMVGGQTDFLVADAKTLTYWAYEGYYLELADLLTETQYKKYAPYFLYYDRAYMEYLDTLTFDDTDIVYPDPTRPDLMEDPIPLMINVSSSSMLSDVYLNSNNTYAVAVTANGSNQENVLNLINLLLS